MAEKKQSRLQPQIPYWYEDLPLRDAPLNPDDPDDQPKLAINALRMDDEVLELSREAAFQRGASLAFGIFGLLFAVFGVQLFAPFFMRALNEMLFLGIATPIVFIVLVVVSVWGIKKSIRTPQNTPVRFIRKTRKVQALEYKTTYNPFAKWKVELREFDWGNVHAELTKTAGYNTKTYSVQYRLMLAECEPGTTQVRDRIVLVPDGKVPRDECNSWAYIRQFMERGRVGLRETFYPGSESFINYVLAYYPYLDPTEVGRRRRAAMDVAAWVIAVVFGVLLFWLFIPMGVFEYIAMKLAPKAEWPEEADHALSTT